MTATHRQERTLLTNRTWQILAVLLIFSVVGWARHLHNYGEDLSSSYIGCRLLAAGEGQHLYSHSSTNFSEVNDPVWDDMANRTGYFPVRLLHPYVQTPLWAYSLQPLCTRMNFRPFCDGFLVLFMLCLSGTLWLVARYWTPALFHPVWIALIYLGLYRSEPFKYAIFLAQTHVLYLFMTVLALILAERRQAGWAGVLLALAAAVKITPGFLLLYWLMTRRYRAALFFIGTSAALLAATVGLLGWGLMHTYVASLRSNADVLLLAFNNQSLAGWWMGLHAPRNAVLHWNIYRLPPGLKAVSFLLTAASSIAGGLLDRKSQDSNQSAGTPVRPYGAVFAMLGATLFAPIAWTHYFILLVIPAMFFAQRYSERRKWVMLACIALILLLNLYPISFGSVHFIYNRFTVIRSQFYAGILAMVALFILRYGEVGSNTPLDSAVARSGT